MDIKTPNKKYTTQKVVIAQLPQLVIHIMF